MANYEEEANEALEACRLLYEAREAIDGVFEEMRDNEGCEKITLVTDVEGYKFNASCYYRIENDLPPKVEPCSNCKKQLELVEQLDELHNKVIIANQTIMYYGELASKEDRIDG